MTQGRRARWGRAWWNCVGFTAVSERRSKRKAKVEVKHFQRKEAH